MGWYLYMSVFNFFFVKNEKQVSFGIEEQNMRSPIQNAVYLNVYKIFYLKKDTGTGHERIPL